jgi:CRISPR-associated protein Cas1
MQIIYILKKGKLAKKEDTLLLITPEEKRYIPLESTNAIFCLNNVSLTSGAIYLLSKHKICVHFFSPKLNLYMGSFIPKETKISGTIIVKQAEAYLDKEKRLKLAKEFVRCMVKNMEKIKNYYIKKGKDISVDFNIDLNIRDIPSLMQKEGEAWKRFYNMINNILIDFKLESRDYRPPTNEVNALISFLNSCLYCLCISAIYDSYLHPSVSYLHEPRERRYSLALDISEMFKPLIIKFIVEILNQKILTKKDFEWLGEECYLNDFGKLKLIEKWDEFIEKSYKHPTLNRFVKFKEFPKLECYKLVKYLLEGKEYKGFECWWL